mgnify:CR=1 FL=1
MGIVREIYILLLGKHFTYFPEDGQAADAGIEDAYHYLVSSLMIASSSSLKVVFSIAFMLSSI